MKTTPYKYAIERGLTPQHVYNFVSRNQHVVVERTDKIYVDSDLLDECYKSVNTRRMKDVSVDELKAEIARRKKVSK